MNSRPDELRRQLGTLWRTALVGFDTVREVVVRSSQSGRLRFDIAVLHNQRSQLLHHLGELVAQQLEEHDWNGASVEMRETFQRLQEVETHLGISRAQAADNAFGAPRGFEAEAAADYGSDDGAEEVPPPKRKRSPRRRSKGAE